MNFFARVGIDNPRTVTGVMVGVVVALVIAAALPTIWPQTFTALEPLRIDTDPENMLRPSEPVRVFHNRMKRELSLYDMVVVGVVDDESPDGVFNPGALGRIRELTEFAETLRWSARDDPARS